MNYFIYYYIIFNINRSRFSINFIFIFFSFIF